MNNSNVNNNTFCTLCNKYTNHKLNDCPLKCIICNGYHKTNEHRCLICNVLNPNHNVNHCPYNIRINHM